MKKLMIVLAAVAMAASAQAASVYWTCKEVQDALGADVSGIAYFVDAATLSRTDALALEGKGASAITTALGSSYSYSGTDGNFGVGKSAAVGNTTLGLADGKDYSVYLMIFDTATVTDSSKFYVTEAKDLSTLSGADDVSQVKWGSQAGATSWASVSGSAVPEPTSGLLMLVGLAGLALRRKRA